MRKNIFEITYKLSFIITMVLFLAACDKNNETEPDNNKPETVFTVSINGTINHSTYTKGQNGTIIFNRFPATVDEFKVAQQMVGGEPHGALALELMAAEMYRRDRNKGTQCIALCNVKANSGDIQLNRWKDLFNNNDQYYARPYQVAAFLEGADPDNDYTPNEPYTIEVRVSDAVSYMQETMLYNSTVITLEVLTKGKDSGAEKVEVIKPGKCVDFPNGSTYFLVQNCPGLYSQVKQIFDPSWNKLK